MKKLSKHLLIGLIATYVLFCLIVVAFPQMFFYEPSHTKANLENAHEYDYLAQEVNYASADGTKLYGWYTPPTGKKFIGWDKTFESITDDITINALFEDIETLTINQINISSNSVSLNISHEIDSIKLYEGESFIKDIQFKKELVITELKSNSEYTIKYNFYGESFEYKFYTLPVEPNISIEINNVSYNNISLIIKEDDIDNIGKILNVQLFIADFLINESKETEITFDNLNENTEYLIVLNYYDSYKDETLTKEVTVITEKEIVIPEIDIMNIDVYYNQISFDVMGKLNEDFDYITDNRLYSNISFMVKELTLYKGEEVVSKISDIKERITIKDLEENTSYKMEFKYSYVIDNETIEKVITKDVTTLEYFSSIFEYEIITNETNSIKILGLKNDIVNLVIPNEYIIDGVSYKITTIGKDAFINNKIIESVTFGKNISLVESASFGDCVNLKEIIFDKVDEEIDLVSFGNYAFSHCISLVNVDLTNTKCYFISSNMFSYCYSLKTVKLRGCEEDIGNHAFKDCKELTTIENGQWITNVYTFAFENCEKLEKVEFNNLKYIYKGAFNNCVSLQSINFDKTKQIDEMAFYNCSSLGEIYLPLSVEMIAPKAFANCPSLVINTAHNSKPELWYDVFKDDTTVINYNVVISND